MEKPETGLGALWIAASLAAILVFGIELTVSQSELIGFFRLGMWYGAQDARLGRDSRDLFADDPSVILLMGSFPALIDAGTSAPTTLAGKRTWERETRNADRLARRALNAPSKLQAAYLWAFKAGYQIGHGPK